MIEHPLQPFQIETAGAHEVQQDSRIEGSATRSHGQAIDRRETHRRSDTLAVTEGTHTGAIAKVRYHCALKITAVERGQSRRDVFIRQAVKSVAPQAFLRIMMRQREGFCDPRLSSMERCVKARHLGKMRR